MKEEKKNLIWCEEMLETKQKISNKKYQQQQQQLSFQ